MTLDEAKDNAIKELRRKVVGLEAVQKRLVEAIDYPLPWLKYFDGGFGQLCFKRLTEAVAAAKSPTKTLDEMLRREREQGEAAAIGLICGKCVYQAPHKAPCQYDGTSYFHEAIPPATVSYKCDAAAYWRAKASPKAAEDK